MKTLLKLICGGLLVIFAFLLVAPLQEVESELNNKEFIINSPYKMTVLKLAKSNTLEKIVQTNGGKIYNKQWDKFVINADKIQLPLADASLEFSATGRFIVETHIPYSHKAILKFVQMVQADKDELKVLTVLLEEDRAVREHSTVMTFSKFGDKTKVKLSNRMVISLRMPLFWHEEFQARVDSINLSNQKYIVHLLEK